MLINPPEVLQVLSDRLQKLILAIIASVWMLEMSIYSHTLASFIRVSHIAILSSRFFFSLC